MDLLQIRYFQTIARMGSVSNAARYHSIPQSAMSQTLRRLERDLGDIRLFDRINNRIYLNENGRQFLEHVNIALTEIDNGVQAVQHAKHDAVSGAIHLLILENSRFITNCISKFSGLYPDVNFYISHNLYGSENTVYDLCVSSHTSYQQMKNNIPLIRERIILAVHESHPLANRESIQLIELKNEKFISMTEHTAVYDITRAYCGSGGFEPDIFITCDDPYYIRKYISQNMGVCLAPSLSWKDRFRENTRLVPVDSPPIYTTSYLLWNEHCYQSAAVKAFRHFLKDESKTLEGNLLN